MSAAALLAFGVVAAGLIGTVALARPPDVVVTEEAPLPPPPPPPRAGDVALPVLAETDIPDVREELSSGVYVNWTRLVLEVTAEARGYGVGANRRAVEQEARRLVGPGMLTGSAAVRVTGATTFAALEQNPAIGDALRSRVERWGVAEVRYYSSGSVSLSGELSLQELLKPWALSVAKPIPAEPPGADEATGLIVDARSVKFHPSYAPHLIAADGRVVYDAILWDEHAMIEAPVVYVGDATHPAIARAGDRPLHVTAIAAQGDDLVVSDADAARLAEVVPSTFALRRGTTAIVVTP